ncbi:MAG: [NiFe]-hydrogenase assembly chaperone HybE [Chromatiales bacterium]|nr:[NiFe]-hydrogenase assembly chaperone HybE [Chromatiales bacterium]
MAAFRDIERTRMAGLPILHPALSVEAVGFRTWQGHWLGALITPWFMNAVIVPGTDADWISVPEGAWVDWRLPVGDLRFYCVVEPGVGEIHAHSLYSPVTRFADQAGARAEAQRCLGLRNHRAADQARGTGRFRAARADQQRVRKSARIPVGRADPRRRAARHAARARIDGRRFLDLPVSPSSRPASPHPTPGRVRISLRFLRIARSPQQLMMCRSAPDSSGSGATRRPGRSARGAPRTGS